MLGRGRRFVLPFDGSWAAWALFGGGHVAGLRSGGVAWERVRLKRTFGVFRQQFPSTVIAKSLRRKVVAKDSLSVVRFQGAWVDRCGQ